MAELSQISEDVAADLWHRFRAIALVIDQADRFVGLSPTGELVDAEIGWFKELSQNESEVGQIAEDLLLRAFRTALEPANHTILEKLIEQTGVSYAELIVATGLNRLSVSERVNDLIQAGLALKDVQTGQVQATKAAQGILHLFQKLQEDLRKIILQKLREA